MTNASSVGAATAINHRKSAMHFPLKKAISRRLWKVWGLGLTGLLVGAAILAAGYVDAIQLRDLGPGFHSLFDLSAGRAIRYFSSVQFLLAGQIALFIWWCRSRSLNDFAGRYRIWAWLTGICFIASFAIGIDAHVAAGETVAWLAIGQLSSRPELAWIAPVAFCVVLFLWMMHADMRDSRASLTVLWLAALSWTASGVVTYAVALPLDPLVDSMVKSGTTMFGHWCLMMCLLLHARHVVYKSAEPPLAKPSRSRSKWRLPLFGRTAVADAEAAAKTIADTRATKKQPVAKKSAPSSDDTVVARKPAMSARGEEKAEVAAPKSKPLEPAREPMRPAAALERPKPMHQQKPVAPTHRIDDAEDDDDDDDDGHDARIDKKLLKGLSKRERREMRKQWREQQREARAH